MDLAPRARLLGRLASLEVARWWRYRRPGDVADLARIALATAGGAATVPGGPVHAQIEPTTRCNLRCAICEHSFWREAETDLPVATLARFLDAMPTLRSVDLTGIGEPLLHRELAHLVQAVTRRGLRTRLTTNGVLLEGAAADLLLREPVDEVHVSFDAARARTFAVVRSGAPFDRILGNVRAFAARAAAAHRPAVYLVLTLCAANLGELDEFVDLAAAVGARPKVQGLLVFGAGLAHAAANPLLVDPDGAGRALARAAARAARLGLTLERPRPRSRSPLRCRLPWLTTYVLGDGTVLPCCLVGQSGDRAGLTAAHGRGTLGVTDLAAWWNGAAQRRLRADLAHGLLRGPCTDCPVPWGRF